MGELIHARSVREFMNACRLLESDSGWVGSFEEPHLNEMVLPLDSLWSDEEVAHHTSTVARIAAAISETSDEDVGVRLVHRLQLASGCSPAVENRVRNFLSKACV